ncbi:CoB--CoM heterodisulfide reductase subunit C [Methanolobus sp. ZRKC2]|uniref:CoB--CoM heterodisulfide reductase subunit C n=1 Tax=Methanolobus sp. ZRKC2 TaxID=3125783 RepID=UPI00324A577A
MLNTPQNDAGLLDEVKEACKDIFKCMQCGVCSGSCPSGRHTSLNIRKLVRKAAKNSNILQDEELWMCTTCYNCQERCPRNIDIVDAMLKIRAIAAHEGIMHPEHITVSELLLEYGHAVPIDEENRKRRIKLGLNELPETVHKYPEELEEVKILLDSCEFNRVVDKKDEKSGET